MGVTASVAEPFRDSNSVEARHSVNVRSNMQRWRGLFYFMLFLLLFFFYLGGTNYASSSTASHRTLSNPCSCECICPYSVSHQREHKHALFGPRRSRQQLGEHANNRHTGLFLSLSVSLSRYATAGPLSPSGSHRFDNPPMLLRSTHCDEERVGASEH